MPTKSSNLSLSCIIFFFCIFTFASLSTSLSKPSFSDVPILEDLHGKSGAFSGEHCFKCHGELNDDISPSEPSAKYDVIIVGGGVSGLSAAYYLKNKNIIILEKESEVGGKMQREKWQDIYFSRGAAYHIEPSGILKSFYNDLGLNPTKIPSYSISAYIDGKFVLDCWGKGVKKLPFHKDAIKSFKNAVEDMREINEKGVCQIPDFMSSPEMLELDNITAMDYLSRKYHPEVLKSLEYYCRSCFGEGLDAVSAYAFTNFFSSEFSETYTYEGGLGAIAEALYKKLASSCEIITNALVLDVRQDDKRVLVTYKNNGNLKTIEGKAAIMAVPSVVAKYIVKDLPAEKLDAMNRIKYSAYLVAAVLLNETIYSSYGLCTYNKIFTDIVVADWLRIANKKKILRSAQNDRKSVLNLYIPIGIQDKLKLHNTPPEQLKDDILRDLESVFPKTRHKVVDVKLFRWGHAMHLAEPGFVTKIAPILKRPYKRIFFAGVETQGLPCIESAVYSGYFAAEGASGMIW